MRAAVSSNVGPMPDTSNWNGTHSAASGARASSMSSTPFRTSTRPWYSSTGGPPAGRVPGVNRATSTAPGTMVKRAGSVPSRWTTSSANDRQPISTAPAWSSTRTMASRCVSQQEPTQWPSPPWMDTTLGTPVSREASSTAHPHG